MAPLSLKIVQDDGAVTRKVKLDANLSVLEATAIIKEKALLPADAKPYGLFLRSHDNDLSGVWLEDDRNLIYYMLRDGDRLDYMCKIRNLRLRMLDGTVKTLQVDQSRIVGDLMVSICSKLGITNQEEYGLCFDPDEVVEDRKENKAAGHTGTLTLKKKSQMRERDIEFEQLSKKLKTDDNVEWIDVHKTLSEVCTDPSRTLLLKRRLYYSDRKVDSRDPVQLNLLYVQTRDNILTSRHPITEEKAAEFAGIQCHIQFGDFHEEKHKSGLIENLNEYLPEQYCSSWGIEKKILKEFSKHVGTSELEAKHQYTKTARSLPTYGVTFFLVKEVQKGKKKLIHRLLGINADAILRLDERTKEIIQEWPLTHVKTYSAGKGNSFTLNFGDYSDEDYSVKTRDAFRIRDILESYIDLIRKRMLAEYDRVHTQHGYISQDNVGAATASTITVVSNNPMKLMEESFVGPNQIVQTQPGQAISQGAQIVTVEQMMTSGMLHKQGQGVISEVPVSQDLNRTASYRLKRVSSKSMKVVTFFTDPTDNNIAQARALIEEMNDEMPHVTEGILKTANNAPSEDKKQKLLDQMQELDGLVKLLAQNTEPGHVNPSEAETAAKKIAEASTQMYFALDPGTQRRSLIIQRSRGSFIADERTERNMRHASYIAASGSIDLALNNTEQILAETYSGPPVDDRRVAELERSAFDKLAKLNAAIAHHFLAISDPSNVDYNTAVNSLNTIHELMPELARDGQALASIKDGKSRQDLIDAIKELSATAKVACTMTASEDDKGKWQDVVQNYTQAGDKLMFILGRGRKPDEQKEKAVRELAQLAEQQTCALAEGAQQLSAEAAARPAVLLYGAAARALAAAAALGRQAQLTAPTIHEPHCQSALRAAAEALASSVQHLGTTWAPLVQDRKDLGDKLQKETLNVASTLDKLSVFYTDLSGQGDVEMRDVSSDKSKLRQSLTNFQDNYMVAMDILNKPSTSTSSDTEAKAAEMRLADRLGRLNAALAALSKAYADKENPDYASAESAMSIINELMPGIAEDTLAASTNKDEKSRAAMMDQLRHLYTALAAAKAGPHAFTNDDAQKLAEESGKLVYIVGKRINPDREQQIMELSMEACKQVSGLLSEVKQISEEVGGEKGSELDDKGAVLADAAGCLMATAQITAPSISSPECRGELLNTADTVSASARTLAAAWAPLTQHPRQGGRVPPLDRDLKKLEDLLDKLRAACDIPDLGDVEMHDETSQAQNLKFTHTLGNFQKKLDSALDVINKPSTSAVSDAEAKAAEMRLADRLGRLNAALAALSKAYSDKENPDYATAESVMSIINELMPEISEDTLAASTNKDAKSRAAMMDQLRHLYTALAAINAGPETFTNDDAQKLAEESSKLVYIVGKRINPDREQHIMDLSMGACKQVSDLLSEVQQVSEEVGGEKGAELDGKGAGLADAAGSLMATAQITAPSISSPECRGELLNTADTVSASVRTLAAAWAPLTHHPQHGGRVPPLDRDLKKLEDLLDKLRAACDIPDLGAIEVDTVSPQVQKLKFTQTLENFQKIYNVAVNVVNKPSTSAVSEAEAKLAEMRLADRLGRLNAALAGLSKAYADKENPDYATAESAISAINELMPEIAKDTLAASTNKDAKSRAAMMDQLRHLYTALAAVKAEPQAFTNEDALKMADESGKLIYIVGKRVNPDREQQIMDLSMDACKQVSGLLSGVQQISEEVGGEPGSELDDKGAVLADAAGCLMATAQITAPSISSPECRGELLNTADTVSVSVRTLAAAWAPLTHHPQHGGRVPPLDRDLKKLEDLLDKLRAACDIPDLGAIEVDTVSPQVQKLKFTQTLENFQNSYNVAVNVVNKPSTSAVSEAEAKLAEMRLADRLGRLNAALAGLSKAYADKENPDYATAESAISAINELMPEIAKDTLAASTNKDAKSRAAMMDQLRHLYTALAAVKAEPQAFTNEDALKMADESGKLIYIVGKRVNPDREQQIMDLSMDACKQVSGLLSGVQQISEEVGGEPGSELDDKGAVLADAAGCLMATAQITAPSISSPECRGELLNTADTVSASARTLAAAWAPLTHHPRHGGQLPALDRDLKKLEDQLDKLRAACDIPDLEIQETMKDLLQEKQKLLFIKTIDGAKEKFAIAQKELNKPATPAEGTATETVRRRLADRLAALSAALAALRAATTDPDKTDYVAAQRAMATISELMPQVIQDTKTVSSSEDQLSRAEMLAKVQDLCHVTDNLYHTAHDPQGFKDAVKKCGEVSNQLVFIVSPKAIHSDKELVAEFAREACAQAFDLQGRGVKVAEGVGGDWGVALKGGSVALGDAARDMLHAAQSGAGRPLQTEVSRVGHATLRARLALRPVRDVTPAASALHADLGQLQHRLDRLLPLCGPADTHDVDSSNTKEREQQKLHFIKTLQEAQGKCADAQKHFNKPPTPARGTEVEAQKILSQRLARLNAAIASLITAVADHENPDYKAAEQAATTISELLPHVVKDTKTASLGRDDATRDVMLARLKDLYGSAQKICTAADGSDPKGYNGAVTKFADASNKLVYVVTPQVNPFREQQIIELAGQACSQAAQVQKVVGMLAAGVGGQRAELLQKGGQRVDYAAREMVKVAQVTAASVSDPSCREELVTSAGGVSLAALPLRRDVLSLCTVYSEQAELAQQLDEHLQQLEDQLTALRKASEIPDDAGPPLSNKPAPPTKPFLKPGVPKRSAPSLPNTNKHIDSTLEFLNMLRCEESQGQSNIPCVAKSSVETDSRRQPTEEEIRAHKEFVMIVKEAEEAIKRDEDALVKCSAASVSGAALSHPQLRLRRRRLRRALARAAVRVAALVAASYVDKIDYAAASQSITELSQLMSNVAENGKHLSDNVDEAARKAVLNDVVQVCAVSRKLCEAATTDREKLNETAVEFGHKSAKLLSIVSNDVDPALEKEIISRAKAIGDSASRVASAVTSPGAPRAPPLCAAGTLCIDAAGKLLYTSKVTAPMIHEPCCQEALVSSADNLSSKLQTFRDSWRNVSEPQHAGTVDNLSKETDNLEKLLEALRRDVKGGNMIKRREIEHLVVENTPLRELTVKILNGAKAHTESAELEPSQKVDYASYSDRLAQALRNLDLACARCKKAPHDSNQRKELDNAIQNLQMTLLQTRPKRGDKGNSNIVDLRDFIEEMCGEAKTLTKAAYEVNVPTAQDKKILGDIREKCGNIETKAQQLMNFDDILEIEHVGEECNDLINKINADIKEIQDAKAKRLLLSKISQFTESCDMLRFATKSSISATDSATLDSTLDDLDDIESRLIKSIVEDSKMEDVTSRGKHSARKSSAASNLCRELASPEGVTRSTLTAYIAATRGQPVDNNLLRHLYKLAHLVKAHAAARARRAALWQPRDSPDVALIAEHILQEIHSNSESAADVKDITKLLVPSAPIIYGDQNKQEDTLQHLSSKLSKICGELTPSTDQKKETLLAEYTKRANNAVATAIELDAVARGCRANNSNQLKHIDKAAKEMKLETYNVLKIAEEAANDPKNPYWSRKLLSACEKLNAAINKLVYSSSSAAPVSLACAALSRDVAARRLRAAPQPGAAPYDHAVAALDDQKENIYKLKSEQPLPRQQFLREVDELGTAVTKSTDIAENCAFFIAVSDQDKDIAKTGLVDVPQIQKSIESIQDSCMAIIGASAINQANEEKDELHKRVQEFSWVLEKAQAMVKDEEVKVTLARAKGEVCEAAQLLETSLKDDKDLNKVTPKAVTLLSAVSTAHSTIEQCPLYPAVGNMSPETKTRCDELIGHSQSLLSHTMELLQEVKSAPQQQETITWTTFSSRKKVIDSYDALLKTVKVNGHRAGVLFNLPEEEIEEEVQKSYIEMQVVLANKWLRSPTCKAEVKAVGQQAVRNIVDLGRQMSEDLSVPEREETRNLITETEELFAQCNKKYDQEKTSLLMDRIKVLRKAIERGVVCRLLEAFLDEAPLADLDTLADGETDASKRQFILERKIASLLAQLGRVNRTARFVAFTGVGTELDKNLMHCSEQTELLAPMLVKAAEQRINHPDDEAAVEKYKKLLAQYVESMAKVRELCDRAVDPMDFVQAAGDTIQTMRDDNMSHNNDPQKCHYTSTVINKLANRVMFVGLSSPAVSREPALAAELAAAQRRLRAAAPAPSARASRMPDWKDSAAEALRMTGDVESALGGENIFKQQPTTANQPIYSVARDLHESVREWSSRDNEIVATARRMAVLMARLSEYMETDKKKALITTSKSIVAESQEVAELAKKLAHECTDVRIKTNLLQLVGRIPTISGQLKMLITVKGSSLGHQGNFEDKEAMDMLVVNAQSLMMCVQEVVKAAAGASVKIMSQRGPRLRWVRKNYY